MKRIKLGIRGAYGEKNFGDDALQYFLYKWTIKNNIKASFIGVKCSYLQKLLPNLNYIDKTKLHRFFINTLILGGGTQFFSFRSIEKPPSKIKLLFTNPFAFIKKGIMLINKNFFYPSKNFNNLHALGIGFGPFVKNSTVEKKAINEVSQMASIFPRDKYSYEFAKKYNDNTFKGTDICFLPDIIDYSRYINTSNSIKKIGIIVRDWNYISGGEHYLDVILSQIDDFKEYQVDFIFFKDEDKCEEKLKNQSIIKWNPKKQSINDFLAVISNYDLFISARFHGVIFGGLLNIPSIAIEIEPKLNLTTEFLGNGVVVWKQPFDNKLISIIQNISLDLMKKELKNNVDKQSIIAKKMFDELLKLIRYE